MNKRRLLKRWLFALLLIVFIIAVGNGIRPSADEVAIDSESVAESVANQAINGLEAALGRRAVSAEACDPTEEDPNKCEPYIRATYGGGSGLDITAGEQSSSGVAAMINSRLFSKLNNCVQYLQDPGQSLDGCSVSKDENRVYFDVSVNFSDADFVSTFKSPIENNTYADKLSNIGQASARYALSKPIIFSTGSGISSEVNNINSHGSIGANVKVSLDGSKDNSDSLNGFGGYNYTDLSGTWKTSISGKVNLGYQYEWDWVYSEEQTAPEIKLKSLTFCADGCTVNVTDDIQFTAKFDPLYGNHHQGDINYSFLRDEKQTGSGYGDVETGKIYWNTDRTTLINEDRSISLNLLPPQYTENLSYHYDEKFTNNYLSLPFLKQSTHSYKYDRNQSYTYPQIGPAPTPEDENATTFTPYTQTVEVDYNFNSSRDHSAISSDGGGTLTVGSTGSASKASVLLDVNGSSVIEKALRDYSSNDFYGYVDNLTNQVGYMWGSSDPIVMSTPTVKVLPSMIVSIIYDNNDEVTEINRKLVDKIMLEGEAVGANMSMFEVSNEKELLKIFADAGKVPDGAWVMYFGHGSPLGPGSDFSGATNINDIRAALDDRHLSLLIAGSCNSARWSSLADQVVGSVVYGFATERHYDNSFSTVALLGGNAYSYTTDDIGKYVSSLLGKMVVGSGNGCVLGNSSNQQSTPEAQEVVDPINQEGQANQEGQVDQGGQVDQEVGTTTEATKQSIEDFPSELPSGLSVSEDYTWYVASDDTANLPVLESLPEYAPDPVEYMGEQQQSFITDLFNFEPAPEEIIYNDPYYNESYMYEYQSEPEPLFNDWYDYVNPVEYMDYSYGWFENSVNSFVDYIYDGFEN